MANIVQDYKNWKSACRDYKKAQDDFNIQYQSMIRYMSLDEFMFNIGLMKLFTLSLPKNEGQPNYEQEFVQQYELSARTFRSTACFFKLNQKLYQGTLFETNLSIKEVGTCMNNHDNGMIIEFACEGCPCFEELAKYQALRGRVAAAKQKREDAKQQLFSRFWKHQAKGI